MWGTVDEGMGRSATKSFILEILLLHVWCVFFFFNFNQILGSTCSICYVVELFEICCAFCVPVCEEFTVNQPEPQHR